MPRLIKLLLSIIFAGVGIGVIGGSTLKALNPYNKRVSNINIIAKPKLSLYKNKKRKRNNHTNNSKARNEILQLSNAWGNLSRESNDLEASGYIYFLDNNKYAELNPNSILPAASSIKVPILIALLKLVDQGNFTWNENLILKKELIGGGAGWMAYQPLETLFPIYEAATEMIRISDNTATNLIIDKLGGIDSVNKIFTEIGLNSTKINNLLPDLEGTNVTTVKDLAKALSLVDTGNLLSQRSRDLFREIMNTSVTNRLIPGGILEGLGKKNENTDYYLMIKGYRVYNKTGDIGIAYADTGLIQMPNNTRAVVAFIVKGPFNDPRSSKLIRDMASSMSVFLQEASNE